MPWSRSSRPPPLRCLGAVDQFAPLLGSLVGRRWAAERPAGHVQGTAGGVLPFQGDQFGPQGRSRRRTATRGGRGHGLLHRAQRLVQVFLGVLADVTVVQRRREAPELVRRRAACAPGVGDGAPQHVHRLIEVPRRPGVGVAGLQDGAQREAGGEVFTLAGRYGGEVLAAHPYGGCRVGGRVVPVRPAGEGGDECVQRGDACGVAGGGECEGGASPPFGAVEVARVLEGHGAFEPVDGEEQGVGAPARVGRGQVGHRVFQCDEEGEGIGAAVLLGLRERGGGLGAGLRVGPELHGQVPQGRGEQLRPGVVQQAQGRGDVRGLGEYGALAQDQFAGEVEQAHQSEDPLPLGRAGRRLGDLSQQLVGITQELSTGDLGRASGAQVPGDAVLDPPLGIAPGP
ncbi:hypothetical protein [Streptomyces fungicidicus]|uniref:hypothetical protein n=1 Tax=Streptomyces fungicidicus TaxID=68203 RepID=UPI003D72ACC3